MKQSSERNATLPSVFSLSEIGKITSFIVSKEIPNARKRKSEGHGFESQCRQSGRSQILKFIA